MDFKYASSLLIFVFLVMNICLGVIYYNKVQQSKILDTQHEKTLSFKEEHIKLPEKMPIVDNVQMNYVSGKSKIFDKGAEGTLQSTISEYDLSTHIKLEEIEMNEIIKKLELFMKTIPYEGTDYILSGIDRQNKKIIYEQTFNRYPILNNDTARIVFQYNDDKEIVSYKQTNLEDLKVGLGKNNKKKPISKPLKAIETLYYQNALQAGDEVATVRLGYYSIAPNIEGQVLKPTWQVAIIHKDKTRETLYVDALSPEEKILK